MNHDVISNYTQRFTLKVDSYSETIDHINLIVHLIIIRCYLLLFVIDMPDNKQSIHQYSDFVRGGINYN